MTTAKQTDFARNWQDISANLLKLGATAYGGPAIMGIMQAELQEKRQWVSKDQFLEGLSLVNSGAWINGADSIPPRLAYRCRVRPAETARRWTTSPAQPQIIHNFTL